MTSFWLWFFSLSIQKKATQNDNAPQNHIPVYKNSHIVSVTYLWLITSVFKYYYTNMREYFNIILSKKVSLLSAELGFHTKATTINHSLLGFHSSLDNQENQWLAQVQSKTHQRTHTDTLVTPISQRTRGSTYRTSPFHPRVLSKQTTSLCQYMRVHYITLVCTPGQHEREVARSLLLIS